MNGGFSLNFSGTDWVSYYYGCGRVKKAKHYQGCTNSSWLGYIHVFVYGHMCLTILMHATTILVEGKRNVMELLVNYF